MNNTEKCSACISLNKDCNALTFCCLIGKTPVESLSEISHCTFTDEDSICYHHEKLHHILKIYNDMALILGNSTLNKLKVPTMSH